MWVSCANSIASRADSRCRYNELSEGICCFLSKHVSFCCYKRVVSVRLPSRRVRAFSLIPPARPSFSRAACEQFEIRARAACLDDCVLLVGFSRMLSFSRCKIVYLPTSGRECPRVPAAHAKQDHFRNITEIKADASTV